MLSAPAFNVFLPFPVVKALGKSIDSKAKLENEELDRPGIVRAWISKYNYKPNEFIAQFEDDPFLKYTSFYFYPFLVVISPPFFPYSWEEVKGSFDPVHTKAFDKELRNQSRQFYEYLDRSSSLNLDSYNNEYIWNDFISPGDTKKWNHIWEDAYKGNYGKWEEEFSSLAKTMVIFDYEVLFAKLISSHSAPETSISQGKYESTRHYKKRVMQASEKANSYAVFLSTTKKDALKRVLCQRKWHFPGLHRSG